MGTRSLTYVLSNWDQSKIIKMYRQYDGYPSGHGQQLHDFLKGFVITNGIMLGDNRKIANGTAELAAMLVHHFKGDNESGNIYLQNPGNDDLMDAEYVYTVYNDEKQGLCFRCKDTYTGATLFDGPVEDFNAKTVEKIAYDQS